MIYHRQGPENIDAGKTFSWHFTTAQSTVLLKGLGKRRQGKQPFPKEKETDSVLALPKPLQVGNRRNIRDLGKERNGATGRSSLLCPKAGSFHTFITKGNKRPRHMNPQPFRLPRRRQPRQRVAKASSGVGKKGGVTTGGGGRGEKALVTSGLCLKSGFLRKQSCKRKRGEKDEIFKEAREWGASLQEMGVGGLI